MLGSDPAQCLFQVALDHPAVAETAVALADVDGAQLAGPIKYNSWGLNQAQRVIGKNRENRLLDRFADIDFRPSTSWAGKLFGRPEQSADQGTICIDLASAFPKVGAVVFIEGSPSRFVFNSR